MIKTVYDNAFKNELEKIAEFGYVLPGNMMSDEDMNAAVDAHTNKYPAEIKANQKAGIIGAGAGGALGLAGAVLLRKHPDRVLRSLGGAAMGGVGSMGGLVTGVMLSHRTQGKKNPEYLASHKALPQLVRHF